eukprot:SAG22_NODE_16_length_32723_cov_26.404825_12_plen_316_part_00
MFADIQAFHAERRRADFGQFLAASAPLLQGTDGAFLQGAADCTAASDGGDFHLPALDNPVSPASAAPAISIPADVQDAIAAFKHERRKGGGKETAADDGSDDYDEGFLSADSFEPEPEITQPPGRKEVHPIPHPIRVPTAGLNGFELQIRELQSSNKIHRVTASKLDKLYRRHFSSGEFWWLDLGFESASAAFKSVPRVLQSVSKPGKGITFSSVKLAQPESENLASEFPHKIQQVVDSSKIPPHGWTSSKLAAEYQKHFKVSAEWWLTFGYSQAIEAFQSVPEILSQKPGKGTFFVPTQKGLLENAPLRESLNE